MKGTKAMAVLRSEDDECASSLELIRGNREQYGDQTWQRFSIVLRSGEFILRAGKLKERPRSAKDRLASVEVGTGSDEGFFCRSPQDEVANLSNLNFRSG